MNELKWGKGIRAILAGKLVNCRRFTLPALLLLTLLPALTFSQKYHLTYYSTVHGLPTNEIRHVTQDQFGYLWLASDDGLVRFDGYGFQTFSKELPSQYGRFFCHTHDGILYSHDAGISLIRPAVDTADISLFMEVDVNSETAAVYYPNRIFRSVDGAVWISQPNGKITRITDNVITQFDLGSEVTNGKSDSRIILTETDNERIWAATQAGGLYLFDSDKDTFILRETFSTINDMAIYENVIWLGGEQLHRVLINEDKSDVLSTRSYPVAGQTITSLALNSAGNIFVALQDKGLFYLDWNDRDDPKPKTIYSSNDPHRVDELPFRNIHFIHVENDQEIWVCSAEGFGILQKRFFEAADDLPHGNTTAITQTDEGKVFISFGDLFSVKPDRYGYRAAPVKAINKGSVTSLTASGNYVWAGTSTGEIFKLSPFENILLSLDLSWRGEYIFYMYCDSKDRKWVCQAPTEKPIIGVGCLMANNQFREYGAEHGLHNRILVVKESPNNKIYAAGIGAESYLYRYLPEEDEFLNLSLPFDFQVSQNFEVHDFTIDLKGRIWLATTDGLLQYDMERIKRIDLGKDYQDIEIRAITSLPDGSVWLSTDTHGLMRLMDDEVVAIGEEAGLPAKIMAYRTLMADQENRLWVGTVEGAVYTIKTLPQPLKTSTPLIKSTILDEKITATHQLQMTRDQVMHFNFLTNAVYGYDIYYQYKLDDQEWSEQSRLREWELSDLKVGTHTLSVRARKGGGYNWSNPLKIPMEVLPAWYKRRALWIVLAVIGLFLLILLVIWARKRYRKKIRLLHEELEDKREAAFRQETDIAKMQEKVDQVQAESRANILTLELIMRIISVITPGMKWDLVMENLTVYLLRTPGVVAFEIARKKGDKLEIEGYSELTRSFISAREPYDPEDCLACYCQVNNKPLHIANIASDYKKYLLDRDTRIEVYSSAMGVPLYLEHSQKASLFLFSDQKDFFDTSSLKALGVVAAYIEQIV